MHVNFSFWKLGPNVAIAYLLGNHILWDNMKAAVRRKPFKDIQARMRT